jgi:hypothetical protein
LKKEFWNQIIIEKVGGADGYREQENNKLKGEPIKTSLMSEIKSIKGQDKHPKQYMPKYSET